MQRQGDFLHVRGGAALGVMTILLSGCAGVSGPLSPPAPGCMVAPPKLQDVPAGADAIHVLALLRRDYTLVSARLKCMQRYARTAAK